MKNKYYGYLIISLVFGTLCSSGALAAITDVKIVNTVSNSTVILDYDTTAGSYLDNVGNNPDVKLRVYSNASGELTGKWVGLVYRAGSTARVVSQGPASGTTLEPLGGESSNGTHYYADTVDGFKTSAYYPAILQAVISTQMHTETVNDTFTVSTNDTFLELNPESDGWFRGYDGNGQLSGDNTGENQIYGSYSLNITNISSSRIAVSVNWVSYNATVVNFGGTNYTTNKKIINVDVDKIVIGIAASNNTILDSGVTSVNADYSSSGIDSDDDSDDTLTLNSGSYNGTAYIYVNGIKEAEVSVTAAGTQTSELLLKLGWNLISLPLLIL